jgi:ring-1,2-phenylacetyl-CoA epoxidase subunit PaaC
MTKQEALLDYVLRLADNNLILGQRISEWCSHAAELELDIALTNIALDLIGQSRNLYQYAAEVEGAGKSEDDYAYLRDVGGFRNALLVEIPNEDFAFTIARQFFFDVYNYLFYRALQDSKDERLAEIATKSLKEITYHIRFSSEWMIRLGDGTDLSHEKMQTAVNETWDYLSDLFETDEVDELLLKEGIALDLKALKPAYDNKIAEIFAEATLDIPSHEPYQKGGKKGLHTEHLGHILAELQWMQRAYPNAEW